MKTRFAPSPTGLLHLGNLYSALQCQSWAKIHEAQLLLRIEDIDFTRCKPEFTSQMIEDLTWAGILFDGQIMYQSQRSALYQAALDELITMNVLYPCFCTRKQVSEHTINPKSSQLDTYPQTCLRLNEKEQAFRKQNEGFSWRLNSKRVQDILGDDLFWRDDKQTKHTFSVVDDIGDVIIGRKDIQYSYHLVVVVDDAAQAITHIIRGEDLRTSTPVHRVLQLLLGYDSPLYIHHKLIQDERGARLAKSKSSPSLKSLRDAGLSQQNIFERIKKASLS